jgi:hypothetical protein
VIFLCVKKRQCVPEKILAVSHFIGRGTNFYFG